MDEDQLLGLIGRIYDAAVEPRLWSDALQEVADSLGGASCHFLVYDLINNTPTLHAARTDPVHMEQYWAHYAELNPWIPPFLKLAPGSVVIDHEILPREDLVKSEFFNDHLRARNVAHCIGAVVMKSPSTVSTLTTYRSAGKGTFDDGSVVAARKLVPHFQRALQISRKLRVSEYRSSSALDVLDQAPYGVVLLSRQGIVLHVNRLAKEVLNHKDGLSIEAGEVRAAIHRETQAIRCAISAACGSSLSELRAGSLAVTRHSLARSYAVLVAPLPGNGHDVFRDVKPAAVMFITDPERSDVAESEVLQRLYGLTTKEANVASLIALGHGIAHVSDVLGVSQETVRTHLKQVLQKTGTSRQSELVRLILTGPAQIRAAWNGG